ncbi:MAG: hypothetical protein A2249_01940 [Candidatus Jacksonbacteria bacterium RIFOXYA2_FULL_44_7]|nr:MAG: hypothetical protein UW39_C0008G0038 [Parcubacteria group bacterium GW2011_GWC2_44_17]KKT50484.1 MAG: hypothetical protein UW40_C0003G0007 [Parcubacteria group bacterium GW2011_GWF2_44_17]OGY77327.1 MAG: hypothetical protein A2249_01940 [Candidatus Jacksonbacteria bacterium RIFOXYA2_FULL_44_7]HCA66824.1 hypothetical protein [Candidatus Jacksonbacteria bacterium]
MSNMEQGSKIFRAKELTDYMEYVDAKPKRFDDIEINGELLSQREKSPLQQEVVDHAIDFIQEHLQTLGIPSRPYDTKRIVFLPFSDVGGFQWKHNDWILISDTAEANCGIVIHELLHAISSEWYYRTSEFFESLPDRRSVKSGFKSVWRECPLAINFQCFNEVITERIAREVTIAHADYAVDVSGRGKDRLNYYLREIDKRGLKSSGGKRLEKPQLQW